MEHQDWTPVVFHKQKQETKTVLSNNMPGLSKKTKELMNTNEIIVPQKVSLEFRKALQSARTQKKITQKQLATMLQVSPKTITEYENGKAIPNNQFIAKMEKILQTKLPRNKK